MVQYIKDEHRKEELKNEKIINDNQLRSKQEWLEQERFISGNSKWAGVIYGEKYYLKDQTIPFDSYVLEVSKLIEDSFLQLQNDISYSDTNKQKLNEKIKQVNDTVSSITERLFEYLACQNRIIVDLKNYSQEGSKPSLLR